MIVFAFTWIDSLKAMYLSESLDNLWNQSLLDFSFEMVLYFL